MVAARSAELSYFLESNRNISQSHMMRLSETRNSAGTKHALVTFGRTLAELAFNLAFAKLAQLTAQELH